MKGSAKLNMDNIVKVKEIFRLLEIELLLNSYKIGSDFILEGVKDEVTSGTNENREVNVEVKNEYAIEIEIEIKNEKDVNELDLNRDLLEGDTFPDKPMTGNRK